MKPLYAAPDQPTSLISPDYQRASRADNRTRNRTRIGFWLLAFWAPLALFVMHSLLFWPWIVDDAAISFAYARSLATGFGLVAQPGAPPVEGYSNLTWVLLMTPFYRLHLFDPVWTPKIISLLLVALVFVACAHLSEREWEHANGNEARSFARMLMSPAVWLTNWLLALNTPFVVWCASGLENPLYAFLLLALAFLSLRWLHKPIRDARMGVGLGLLAALAAMTRPDGLSFFVAFPLVIALSPLLIASVSLRPERQIKLAMLGYYTLGYALFFGAFIGFRWFYFGDWVPNTFRAKGGPASHALFDGAALWLKFDNLCRGVLSVTGTMVLVVLLVVLWKLRRRGVVDAPLAVGALFLALATANYLLMPSDWMSEYRFATPVALFGSLTIAQLFRSHSRPQDLRFTALWPVASRIVSATILLTISVLSFGPRSRHFAAQPTVPYQLIAREFGFTFNNYARQLNLKHASILLPDVGGTLLHSRLRVYDAGMLTDRRIAATLAKDQPAFYHYVFEQVRPTFIHTHGYWAKLAQFDADPRFRRDYIAIKEKIDPEFGSIQGRPLMCGDYVRRDALGGNAIGSLRRDETPH